ncbi:MAG: Asp-tRNA(Asn)/Glu-tRNA(Gln) amidotransferase subunit GatA [Rhabdochlamydiaceae bacterium]|nr:Asp-tRNA(Asn)/Glu-tRNA(Gln) amidotransferase subunit GatA [Candidatus Amphrikana amoebophyrae]
MYNESALQIAQKFKSGQVSATEITSYFLKRISSGDHKIGSFLSCLEERALQKAKELDQKRAEGKPLGKLAGVPIGIKDNIHVKDEVTTCASKFLSNYIAPYDSTVTKLIEAEDGIILGKHNLDEFAMGSTNENSAFFPTKNPWNENIVAGGSSGGSAASVAAGFTKISLGTDTGGSIRLPAAFCGCVGFKPSFGRVSRYGLVAFGSSLDQIGPLATSVEDAALMMEVIGKHCSKDSTSLNLAPQPYISELKNSVQSKTVGVPFHLIDQLPSEARSHFEQNIELMKKMGLNIIDINLDVLKYSVPVYYIIAPAEASTNLARFDGVLYSNRAKNCETIDDVYQNSRSEGFGPEVKQRILLGTYVLSAKAQDAYYKKAQQVRTLIINAMKKAFNSCDVIATPTAPYSAFDRNSIQDPLSLYLQDIYTIPANLAGLPSISIPTGFTSDDRPFGMQLMGPKHEDARLLRFAHHIEKNVSLSPKMSPHFDKENLA